MSTILGLDLGTNSIGWAIVDEQNEKILDSGSRVFPMGVNLERGNETSKNATRREKRQARRQNFRRKRRKQELAKLLIEYKMFPDIDPTFRNLTDKNPADYKFRKKFKTVVHEVQLPEKLRSFFSIDPYEARAKGYEGKKLTLLEIGRICYHIAQRRGFKKSLESTKKDMKILYGGKPKEGKTGIEETIQKIKKYGTLGNYLYHEDSHQKRLRNRYTLRSMYVEEFNIIWENEKKYHPEVLTEKLRIEIGGSKRKGDPKDGILFYQRPLRSQKHLIANCTFESDKPRSKQSVIPFELFRSYQLVNSIRLDDKPLTDEEREAAVEYLCSRKSNPKFSVLRKKLSTPDGNYNYSDDRKLPTSNTIYNFRKIFGKQRWNKLSLEEQEEIWHIKYFADDPNWLEQYAKDKWGLDNDSIERLKDFNLVDEYANLSRKAMMNILPYLKKGFLYDKAVLLGGLRGAYGSQTWDQMDKKKQKEIEQQVLEIANDSERKEKAIDQVKRLLVDQYDLPEKKAGNLYHHSVKKSVEIQDKLPKPKDVRNPIVQQALHEVRSLVNALIDKHAKPDEIKVELARELKSSKSHRESIRKRQQEREDENIKIKARLDEYGLSHTRSNIHKLKLYNELKQKAGRAINPFNPTKTIGIEELLTGDGYFQIEHIIPESISMDDSLANKTLCDADTNKAKSDQTPYQYFMSQGMSPEDWEHYKDKVFDILPFYKAKKFTSEEEPELDDFIQRQLNDTRYISKRAKSYLKHICTKVTVAQGSVTSMLRYYWGLDGILGGKFEVGNLQDGEYLAAVDGDDQIIEIVEWNDETLDKDQKRLQKKGQFLQGNVSNGIFYPFKQRDDHRHHAVDAMAVACSKQKYLQQISRLNAKGWDDASKKEYHSIEQPWDGFWQDANESINRILVSHKQNDRILTKVKKQLYDYKGNARTDKNGNKLYAEGKAARGRLHRETVYGKHPGPDGEDHFHHRKSIDFIKNHKHLAKVVSPRVRKAVEKRFLELGLDVKQNREWKLTDLPKDKQNQVFFKFVEADGQPKRIPQIRLPNKSGKDIPVKRVRVRETIGRPERLKEGINQFVDPYDNHHAVIYLTVEDVLDIDVVTFWETVELKNQDQPVLRLPADGKEIITTVQENEMFLVGLSDTGIRDHINDPDYLREHLYRVQKISVTGYNIVFRYHTATTIDDSTQLIGISSMGESKNGWVTHNPTKVNISTTGEIKLAGK